MRPYIIQIATSGWMVVRVNSVVCYASLFEFLYSDTLRKLKGIFLLSILFFRLIPKNQTNDFKESFQPIFSSGFWMLKGRSLCVGKVARLSQRGGEFIFRRNSLGVLAFLFCARQKNCRAQNKLRQLNFKKNKERVGRSWQLDFLLLARKPAQMFTAHLPSSKEKIKISHNFYSC